MSEGYADLHLHTTASDGTQGILQLVKRAAAYGLSAIAITDHDTISQELTERVIKINGLEVITGVEIKVDFNGIRGELLGYFVDPACPSLHEIFLFMKRSREERMAKMVKRCADQLVRGWGSAMLLVPCTRLAGLHRFPIRALWRFKTGRSFLLRFTQRALTALKSSIRIGMQPTSLRLLPRYLLP